MNALFSLCGFDTTHIDKVDAGERRFFVFSALVSLLSVITAGLGFAAGAFLTVGVAAAPVAFVVAALFVLNLLRLQHAGSGYPLHHPIEHIDAWRPALTGVVVLLVLGALLVQPLVFFVEKPWLDADLVRRAADAQAVREALGIHDVAPPIVDGLIARGRTAWDLHVVASALLTVLLAAVVAAPGIVRRLGASVVRHYESERWISERMFVDDEWADTRDVVEALLRESAPGFVPPLRVPWADPPYNTRPLVFGLDPAEFVDGRIKFVRVARSRTADTPTIPAPAAPWWSTLSFSPTPLPPPPSLETPLAEPAPAPEPSPEPPKSAPPTSTPTPAPAPAPAPQPAAPKPASWVPGNVADVGRYPAGVARTNAKVMAFCARYLELPGSAVLAALQAAPADAPLHAVFPEWSKLPTLLLKTNDAALDLGLAPLIAIVVERTPDQVERRLRAAAPGSKLSSVFAPELARRILREKPKT